jgi:hypothetical protein
MVTRDSARIAGLEGKLRALLPGHVADIVVL